MQLGEGADLTRKLARGLENGLERGAGGMGFAGHKVSDALSTVTDKASEAGHKLAELIKAPFQRSQERSGPRLNRESGRVVGDWEEESGADEGPVRSRAPRAEDDDAAEEARQTAKFRAERREAQQRAAAEVRNARKAAHAAERSTRVSHHTHALKKGAFEQQVPTSSKVHKTHTQAKRATLKATSGAVPTSSKVQHKTYSQSKRAVPQQSHHVHTL